MTHAEKAKLWELIHEWRKQYDLRVIAGWPRIKNSPLAAAEDAVNLHIGHLTHKAYLEGTAEHDQERDQ